MISNTALDAHLAEDLRDTFEVFPDLNDLFESLSEDARRIYATLLQVKIDPANPVLLLKLEPMSQDIGISEDAIRAALADLDLVALRMEGEDGIVTVFGVLRVLSLIEGEGGAIAGVLVAMPDLGIGSYDPRKES